MCLQLVRYGKLPYTTRPVVQILIRNSRYDLCPITSATSDTATTTADGDELPPALAEAESAK